MITDTSQYHYDTYSFLNSGGVAQCVDVTVDAAACGGGSFGLASYTYLTSFNPVNLCVGYAGARNAQIPTGASGTYSVTVPAGQTRVVEIEEHVAGTGCVSYQVVTGSCSPP